MASLLNRLSAGAFQALNQSEVRVTRPDGPLFAKPRSLRAGEGLQYAAVELILYKRWPFFWSPGMRIGYARVSEEVPPLLLRRQAVQQAGCGPVYEGRARDDTTRRPRKRQPHELRIARALREAGQVPVKAIAARLEVAPSTLYRNRAGSTVPGAP